MGNIHPYKRSGQSIRSGSFVPSNDFTVSLPLELNLRSRSVLYLVL